LPGIPVIPRAIGAGRRNILVETAAAAVRGAALYAKSTAFCLASRSDKILLVHEGIIHADWPLPHLINVLCSTIANPLSRL
jgi:hypothetical protein